MNEEQRAIVANVELLNGDVARALKNRSCYMDRHMHLFAPFAIGETVVRSDSGERVTVVEHYRFHASQNPLLDTEFNVDCRFSNGDNTSRYAGLCPYVSVADYENRTPRLIRVLQTLRK